MESPLDRQIIGQKIDPLIRFFLYVLVFWLPYSQAVIEVCVIIALVLWVAKRLIVACLSRREGMAARPQLKNIIAALRPAKSELDVPISIFLVFCTVSVLLSSSIGQSWHHFLTKTVEWFVIYYLVIEVFEEGRPQRVLLGVFLFTAFAVILDALGQFYFLHQDIFFKRFLAQGRATASFSTPNGLGAYLTIVLLIVPGLIFSPLNGRWKRISLAVYWALGIWTMGLTGSRGAWLGLLLGLIFFYGIWGHMTKRPFVLVLLSMLIVGLSIGIFKQTAFVPKEEQNILNRGTSLWRLQIWEDSFKMFKERPIFGHGINTYMKLFQNYRRPAIVTQGGKVVQYSQHHPTYAHNCYIQMVVETGIVGLFAFLGIISTFYLHAIKKLNISFASRNDGGWMPLGMMAGIFAFLVHSFFDNQFYSLQLSTYLWLMIGWQMSLLRMKTAV